MESSKFNPYATLGLPNDPEISFSKIKKQFNKLSLLYHPDKNAFFNDDHNLNTNQYHDILKAYEILSDCNRRKKYHQPINIHTVFFTRFYSHFDQ